MKVANSNRFYLQGTGNRWLHLATVLEGCREYIAMADKQTGKIYIEECTGGAGPFFVDDDVLAESLMRFLEERGLLDMSRPLLSDNQWLRKNEKK